MRFEMAVMTADDGKEISIIDTEEENAQLFCCDCETEDLIFCVQELQQILDQLNFQNDTIKKLTEKINEQDRRIEGLKQQFTLGDDSYEIQSD